MRATKIAGVMLILGALWGCSAQFEGSDSAPKSAMLDPAGMMPVQESWSLLRGRPVTRSGGEASTRATSKPTKSWRRSTLVPNSSRLQVGDQQTLTQRGLQARVKIDGFRARVVLDAFFHNDKGRQLEGTFQLRLPEGASPYYLAYGEARWEAPPQRTPAEARRSGVAPEAIWRERREQLERPKEARMVPRQQAALAYRETVHKRRIDPALMEWAGAGVFNARIFPISPGRSQQVVVGYDVDLRRDGEDLVYELDLPKLPGAGAAPVDIEIAALPGVEVQAELGELIEQDGRRWLRVDDARGQRVQLRLLGAAGALLVGGEGDEQRFAWRVAPQLPEQTDAIASEGAVFLLDCSLSAAPDRFALDLQLLERVLAASRQHGLQRFAVLLFDIQPRWWRARWTTNEPGAVGELIAQLQTVALEGATDVGAALAEASEPGWLRDEVGGRDLFLLSDGAITWGEGRRQRLAAQLARSGQRLFAYRSGLAGTDLRTLHALTRASGGAMFAVTDEDALEAASQAHLRAPLALESLTLAGGRDLLIAGRPGALYPGQTLLVVGRGAPAADAELKLVLRGADGRPLTVAAKPRGRLQTPLATRLYGHVGAVELETAGPSLRDAAEAYAICYRVVGRTCSLLMLESEADYQRFGILPQTPAEKAREVARCSAASLLAEDASRLQAALADPKAAAQAWFAELKGAGLERWVNKATLADLTRLLASLDARQFEREPAPRAGQPTRAEGWGRTPAALRAALSRREASYDAVAAEAARREQAHGPAAALKALSSLIEQRPGDPVLTRDVAASAIALGFGQQAIPLLERLALRRPWEPQTYRALGNLYAEAGAPALATVCFELGLRGEWDGRFGAYREIIALDYLRFVRRWSRRAPGLERVLTKRQPELEQQLGLSTADLVVCISWNTDATDIDLHVEEPGGEVCYYKNPKTWAGGRLTRDVTRGYGPEMYVIERARRGVYNLAVNYYGQDDSRTGTRTKVTLTIIRHLGHPHETIQRRVVSLARPGKPQLVSRFEVR